MTSTRLHIGRAHVIAGLLVTLVVSSGLSSGCNRQQPIPVRKVLVDIDPAAEQQMKRDDVRGRLAALIAADSGFSTKPNDKDAAVLRLRVHTPPPMACRRG